jgi:hypothetical protein
MSNNIVKFKPLNIGRILVRVGATGMGASFSRLSDSSCLRRPAIHIVWNTVPKISRFHDVCCIDYVAINLVTFD